ACPKLKIRAFSSRRPPRVTPYEGRSEALAPMGIAPVGEDVAIGCAVLRRAFARPWAIPIFNLAGMVRYHGLVNAVGHVGFGMVAFAWGRPRAQSPIRTVAHRRPMGTISRRPRSLATIRASVSLFRHRYLWSIEPIRRRAFHTCSATPREW